MSLKSCGTNPPSLSVSSSASSSSEERWIESFGGGVGGERMTACTGGFGLGDGGFVAGATVGLDKLGSLGPVGDLGGDGGGWLAAVLLTVLADASERVVALAAGTLELDACMLIA